MRGRRAAEGSLYARNRITHCIIILMHLTVDTMYRECISLMIHICADMFMVAAVKSSTHSDIPSGPISSWYDVLCSEG